MLKIDRSNLAAWAKHYRQTSPLLYPDERVVTFLARTFPDREDNGRRKALDIGFGSGRHLALLLDYGFEVYGFDYNKEAVLQAREAFNRHERVRQLHVGSLDEPPFPEGMFDVIVAYGVMFLRPIEQMKRDFQILNRLLKAEGKMVVNFRTKENWFFGKGLRLSDESYELDETAGPYSGMHYTFLDEDQAQLLLHKTGFQVENKEQLELWKENATQRHSWIIFWTRKDIEQ